MVGYNAFKSTQVRSDVGPGRSHSKGTVSHRPEDRRLGEIVCRERFLRARQMVLQLADTVAISPDVDVPLNPDPLVEPSILSITVKIADLLRSGTLINKGMISEEANTIATGLTVEEMAKSIIAGTGWALRPFIQSPTLPKLAEVLKSHPGLYWHPLVAREILYLRRLQSDEREWQRLGWQWESKFDGEYEVYTPPKEVGVVNEQLANLLEAHSAGLLPHKRIQWKRARIRTGRKGGLKNPYPTWEPWSERISGKWLAEDFDFLRSVFKRIVDVAKGKPRTKAAAKEWYRKLAQKVLERSSPVAWWSGYRDYEHGGWKLNLDTALDAMLQGKAGREGKPAYLAYAVLGSLLDATPETIRNTIGNYRHPRRVKKSR